MFIPLSTDRPPKRRPIVNETLVVVNLLVYLFGAAAEYFGWIARRDFMMWGWYDPQHFKVWQLFTYQFMHDPWGLGHIVFNLIFLWVFGNAVESRLGRAGYLGFYLIGGIVAGLAQGMVSDAPIIGASGAIAGVSGAFLALFPRARIKVLIFFFLIAIVEIPALWIISLYFGLNVLNQTMSLLGRGGGGVAYAAHLGGYVYGFAVCVTLLAMHILKREEFDIFFLFKQMWRRQAFRRATRDSQRVWEAPQADTAEQMGRRTPAAALTPEEQQYAERRAEISRLLADNRIEDAARKYRDLLRDAPATTMPERRQIDLANWFYQEGDIDHAVKAYELLLEQYPTSREGDHVRLILALIYTRKRHERARAKTLLEMVRPKLQNENDRALADQLLAELG